MASSVANSVANFDSVLIANRGEIAVRIMRSARLAGLRVIAVYSDADAGLAWLQQADQTVHIGAANPRESYLNGAAILQAAKLSGAQAIHPGYGFLAENADFAQSVLDAGLVWIGPTPAAMRAMGNKAQAKRTLLQSEHAQAVPLLPGYQAEQQDLPFLEKQAVQIGLPLMIKAAAGGGGRGMRLVTDSSHLAASLHTARSEAELAFGNGDLILERAILQARHIEVQIFGDMHGNVVHLGERECSIQRRHQKIIEESPSPAVDARLRARLGAAAIAVARCCGYVGAGTVEFLLEQDEQDQQFWLMEMNTRLQVEHTVTEEITGQDLVAWQLQIAQGKALPLTQQEIDARLASGGHAIEVRVCMEDTAQDFMPQAGRLGVWQMAKSLRCENALQAGELMSSHYDSMLAKLIAHGENREQARLRLLQGLQETHLLGVANNLPFLGSCLRHPQFIAGQLSTDFIVRYQTDLFAALESPLQESAVLAACVLFAAQHPAKFAPELQNFASNAQAQWACEFVLDGIKQRAHWQAKGNLWQISIGQQQASVQILACQTSGLGKLLSLQYDGKRRQLAFYLANEHIFVSCEGRQFQFQSARAAKGAQQNSGIQDGQIRAPFNGRVVRLAVQEGQQVEKGDILMVLEAMKMEHSLRANRAGTVQRLAVAVGSQVQPGAILVEIA